MNEPNGYIDTVMRIQLGVSSNQILQYYYLTLSYTFINKPVKSSVERFFKSIRLILENYISHGVKKCLITSTVQQERIPLFKLKHAHVRLVSLLKCWLKLHRQQTKRSLEQANYAQITIGPEYFHWTSKNVRQNIELCPTMKSASQKTQ